MRALGIPLPSFQIAGGIVLFLFALTMIFGPSKAEQEKDDVGTIEHARSIAVFPLAIPSIASPGAMLGVVLLNDTEKFQLVRQPPRPRGDLRRARRRRSSSCTRRSRSSG